MKVRSTITKITLMVFMSTMPLFALARAGGGGSSGGGGGGGGGGGFSGGGVSHGNGCSFQECPVQNTLFFIVFFAFFGYAVFAAIKRRRAGQAAEVAHIAEADAALSAASTQDTAWDKTTLITLARNTFLEFQRAWGVIDIPALEKILTPDMYKRIALELAVLNNEGRRNPTEITEIVEATIFDARDESENNKDRFSVRFTAQADDKLVEVATGGIFFEDTSAFTEIWDFAREGDSWKLAAIHQATEDAASLMGSIQEFSAKNNFFYNPDFGWLMLPNKGVLFSEGRFGNTDINNHVIGYFRDKIVEFYTMDIWKNKQNNQKTSYLIAQAILPIQHNDILIRRKHLLQFTPNGMVKHEMESNEFIKEFQVCSDPNDNMETFELLTPNFMEMIMKLPFELTIEVVGNTLYLATENKSPSLTTIFGAIAEAAKAGNGTTPNIPAGEVNYDTMLNILSYAFDEMKM